MDILDGIPLHGEGLGEVNVLTLLGGSDLESYLESVRVSLYYIMCGKTNLQQKQPEARERWRKRDAW